MAEVKTVLLVEDDRSIRTDILEAMNSVPNQISMVACTTRAEALDLISNTNPPFDAVITDNDLEDADDAAKEIAQTAIDKGIRVVAIHSGNSDVQLPKGVEFWPKGSMSPYDIRDDLLTALGLPVPTNY